MTSSSQQFWLICSSLQNSDVRTMALDTLEALSQNPDFDPNAVIQGTGLLEQMLTYRAGQTFLGAHKERFENLFLDLMRRDDADPWAPYPESHYTSSQDEKEANAGLSPFLMACRRQILFAVEALLAHPGRARHSWKEIIDNQVTGRNLLDQAGTLSWLGTLLLKAGMDPNQTNADGRTLLFYAKDEALLELLAKNGVDPTIKDKLGRTAYSAQEFASTLSVENRKHWEALGLSKPDDAHLFALMLGSKRGSLRDLMPKASERAHWKGHLEAMQRSVSALDALNLRYFRSWNAQVSLPIQKKIMKLVLKKEQPNVARTMGTLFLKALGSPSLYQERKQPMAALEYEDICEATYDFFCLCKAAKKEMEALSSTPHVNTNFYMNSDVLEAEGLTPKEKEAVLAGICRYIQDDPRIWGSPQIPYQKKAGHTPELFELFFPDWEALSNLPPKGRAVALGFHLTSLAQQAKKAEEKGHEKRSELIDQEIMQRVLPALTQAIGMDDPELVCPHLIQSTTEPYRNALIAQVRQNQSSPLHQHSRKKTFRA